MTNPTFQAIFWSKWPHVWLFLRDLSHNSKTFAATFQQSFYEKDSEISIKQKCHADSLLSCDPGVMASAHSCLSYSCRRGLKLSASKWDTQQMYMTFWFDFPNSVVSFHLQILLILYELLIVQHVESWGEILKLIKRQNTLVSSQRKGDNLVA